MRPATHGQGTARCCAWTGNAESAGSLRITTSICASLRWSEVQTRKYTARWRGGHSDSPGHAVTRRRPTGGVCRTVWVENRKELNVERVGRDLLQHLCTECGNWKGD